MTILTNKSIGKVNTLLTTGYFSKSDIDLKRLTKINVLKNVKWKTETKHRHFHKVSLCKVI